MNLKKGDLVRLEYSDLTYGDRYYIVKIVTLGNKSKREKITIHGKVLYGNGLLEPNTGTINTFNRYKKIRKTSMDEVMVDEL